LCNRLSPDRQAAIPGHDAATERHLTDPCIPVPHTIHLSATQRAFDLLFTIPGLIVLSPALLVLAAGVKINDGGPVFYRGTRMGMGGRPFGLLKFRTMVVNADRIGSPITSAGDPRVTPIGRFLRRHKLDELPQLLNVVAGDMSLVGPRPEDPRFTAQYTDEEKRVLEFRPGITSPASLHFRNEEALLTGPDWERRYFEEVLPKKLRMELGYFPGRTIRKDAVIILKTLWMIGRDEGRRRPPPAGGNR